MSRGFSRSARPCPRHAGFTLVEVIVTVGIILVLIGLLVPALRGVMATGEMSKSMSRMRQVGVWMTSYSSDNLDFVLPSQFDYSRGEYPGKVRSVVDSGYGMAHRGTWADILWVHYAEAKLPDWTDSGVGGAGAGSGFQFEVPPTSVFTVLPDWKGHPFRSDAGISRPFGPGDGVPLPYGSGPAEEEVGAPGYFAANDFFDANLGHDPAPVGSRDGFWTNAQLRHPGRSTYLVDSVAGLTIPPDRLAYDPDPANDQFQLDFRYGESCITLLLDGHVDSIFQYEELPVHSGHPDRITVMDYRVNQLTQR